MPHYQADLLLRNVTLPTGGRADVVIRAGMIAVIGAANTLNAAESIAGHAHVLLPGLADAHVHLDKTYVPITNMSGTLREAVDVWIANRPNLKKADAIARASRALDAAIAHGTTSMRSHINTVFREDLLLVEAALAVRERYKTAIDLQLVALGHPGKSAQHREVEAEALAMGVDLIGDAPSFVDDRAHTMRECFALAEQTGKGIDLHIDENHDPQSRELEMLAELTMAHGMQGRVVAGHCCSLAFMDAPDVGRIIDKVVRAGVHVVALPSCNLVLQGREQWPAPRGVTRVKELLAAGVNVSAGSDNVRDPFNPFGGYDALMAAHFAAHGAHMTGLDELAEAREMVTSRPHAAMGLPGGRIAVGAPADLVLLDSSDPLDAVLCPPLRLATIKRGRVVYRAEIKREWMI
jgi:cytosine/creatinine deaminase